MGEIIMKLELAGHTWCFMKHSLLIDDELAVEGATISIHSGFF